MELTHLDKQTIEPLGACPIPHTDSLDLMQVLIEKQEYSNLLR